jgi:predicted PurR-regulated permease PerM
MKIPNRERKPRRRVLLEFAVLELVVVIVTLTLIQTAGLGAYAGFFAGVIAASAAALGSVVFRSGVEKQTSALLVIVVVLAAGLAVSAGQALSLGNQVSTLKESGRSYCATVNSGIADIYAIFSNTTQTLHQQIANESSMISMLNASKPAGYEGMVATLNNQISQDRALEASFPPETDSPISAFCALVNQ